MNDKVMPNVCKIMNERAASNLIIKLAKNKGLRVIKNSFVEGWSITLPSGGTYCAKTVSDLIGYIKGY